MSSGSHALVLAPCSPGDFASLAHYWVEALGLEVESTAMSDPLGVALLMVRYRGGCFWLAADNWLGELALEPKAVANDDIIIELYAQLCGAPLPS